MIQRKFESLEDAKRWAGLVVSKGETLYIIQSGKLFWVEDGEPLVRTWESIVKTVKGEKA